MLDLIALALGAVANVVLWRALVKSMDEHEKPKRTKKVLFRKRAEAQTPDRFPPPVHADHPPDRRAPRPASRPRDPGR